MLIISRRIWKYFDWISFGLTLTLALLGLAIIFSATYTPELPHSIFFKKQALGIIIGIILYVLCSATDHRTLVRWGYFLYLTTIGLLLFTLVKGTIGMGAQRWINLGLFKLQPSELAKIFFPAFATHYLLGRSDTFMFKQTDFIPLLGILAGSTFLIMKQPDLGTALILLFSGLIMLRLAGLSRKFFICSAILCLIGAPILWNGLKPYQKNRVLVFLGEGQNHKERYQIEQSKIAVGSGGLYGKGFLQGTQTQLKFLPESRTDCIFSVYCEEFGLIGALILLILYALLFLRICYGIARIHNSFMQLFGLGLIIHLLLSTVINIAMVIGLAPVVGIPLPLISYGLSNLFTTFISLGTLNALIMQRSMISK